ncbi:MAG: hypothetical protein RLZZ232_1763 [Planctomycetota bacterium]
MDFVVREGKVPSEPQTWLRLLGFGLEPRMNTDQHGWILSCGRAKFHLSRKTWLRLLGFWFRTTDGHGSTQMDFVVGGGRSSI